MVTIGALKLRRRSSFSGISGSVARRSTWISRTKPINPQAAAVSTTGCVAPHSSRRLIAISDPLRQPASAAAPAMSKRTSGRLGVSGNRDRATSTVMAAGIAWATKTSRHPMASTNGAPTTIATTGESANTAESCPKTRGRSLAGYTSANMAKLDGMVDVPQICADVRNAISA
jgi:hypothetical protein